VKKKIQREGSKCRETACCLDEQRTGGERRVVAACWCTLLDRWLLLVLVLREEQRGRED
jgi:hypothetical protein